MDRPEAWLHRHKMSASSSSRVLTPSSLTCGALDLLLVLSPYVGIDASYFLAIFSGCTWIIIFSIPLNYFVFYLLWVSALASCVYWRKKAVCVLCISKLHTSDRDLLWHEHRGSCHAWMWPTKVHMSGTWFPVQHCWEVGWLQDHGGADFMNKLMPLTHERTSYPRRGSWQKGEFAPRSTPHTLSFSYHVMSSAMLENSRKALTRCGPWSWTSQSPKLEAISFCSI